MKEKWDETFETYLDFINDNNDILCHLRNNYFWYICNKYFGREESNKVKVQCREGVIQITKEPKMLEFNYKEIIPPTEIKK